MMSAAEDFFIGWSQRLPHRLRIPMLVVATVLPAALILLAMALARANTDSGWGNWAEEATLRGTLTALPYPLLRLPPDAAHPQGHTVMLSAFGKAQVTATPALAGHSVQAGGVIVRRGTYEMLIVNDPSQLHAIDAPLPPPKAAVPLGRWRIAGELCDGKCWTGAMRPGSGLAHRACASLCLAGDIPPVLVSAEPAAGASFFLLASPTGGPMAPELRKLAGVMIQLDGTLERRGDMLVFRADPASVRVL